MNRVAVALLLLTAVARAEGPSPLWDDVLHPNRLRCAQLLEQTRPLADTHVPLEQARILDTLLDATRLCPDSLEAFALLGKARIDSGDFPGARRALERARALAPAGEDHDAQLAFQLGFVRSVAGDLEGSLREYRRAEAQGGLGREDWLLAYDLGDDFMALGRLAEAIDAYRRSARLAPNRPMPFLALAVALDRDQQLEKSHEAVVKALNLDRRAAVLQSGQYIFVPPEDVHYYLALVAATDRRLGDPCRELAQFVKALPESPYAPRARERLRSCAAAR